MSLEQQAESRKARLEALRKRKRDVESGAANEDVANGDGTEVFRFRNYDPTTGSAKGHDPSVAEEDTVEKEVEGLMDRVILEDEELRGQELDLVNIQPKKPNWDLKRDLDKKLEKLGPQTQRAIAQLIRQRLQGKGEEDAPRDISSRMAQRQMENAEELSDEDD
ncbi:mRNA splicing factor [Atractiella rhizophila]|nr:mRNA splicing factor [Atractiella rhizophila]